MIQIAEYNRETGFIKLEFNFSGVDIKVPTSVDDLNDLFDRLYKSGWLWRCWDTCRDYSVCEHSHSECIQRATENAANEKDIDLV